MWRELYDWLEEQITGKDTLAELNDGGTPFAKIAEVIEAQF